MSNALTNTNAGMPAAAGDYNPFATAGAGAGSTTFVKFQGANGDFLAGQDEEELEHGTEFAADIWNSKFTWSFWWDGKVLETVDNLVRENPNAWDQEPDYLPDDPDGVVDMTLEDIRAERKRDPANFRDGWSVQGAVNLRPVDGSDEEYTLKLNAGVAMGAFRNLLNAFGRQFRVKQGLTPIITLDARKYKSKIKGVGTRYAPIFKIVDWRSEDELLAAAGEDPSMYEDAPETATQSALPAPEAETEAEADEPTTDEAPRRGRRGARGRGNFG